MDVLDKFFTKYSYKFPKGYPDLKDNQDILLMESILEEDFGIVLEGQTFNDVIHETFFSLAFNSLIKNESYSIPKNLKELETQINNSKNLKDKERARDIIIDRFKRSPDFFIDKDIEQNFSKKLTPYIEDAITSAESTYKALEKAYPEGKIEATERVAKGGEYGVADNLVYVDGEPVFISLKYEEGQFGSLSVKKLINLMYGEGTLEKGLLASVYDTKNGKTSLDNTLKPFIEDINDAIDDNTEGNEFKEDFRKFMEKQSKDFKTDITTPQKFKESGLRASGNEKFDTWISDPTVRKLYGRLHLKWVTDKKPHQNRKRDNINSAIDDFLNTKNIDKSRIADTISYLFRQDDDKFKDKDYIYVSQGGNKIIKIPSKNKIFDKVKKLDFDLGDRNTNSTDYQRDILIKDDEGNLLVTVPLNFRFSAGQFRDNYDQKGTKPTFDAKAFNEFFEASGDIVKATME